MNRARMAGTVCLAAGLLMLASCGGPSRGAWEKFLAQTDALHRAETAGAAPDLTAYVYPDALMGTYDAQNPWYLDGGTGKSTLMAQEAREDAEACFQLLHDFYGGYGYFGGDEAFQPALAQVLSELSGKSNVSAKSLRQSLEGALEPLIRDGHFAIDGHYLCASERQDMYYVPDLYLDEKQAAAIDPVYVQRTVGPDGALTWCFAALSSREIELPETLGEYVGLDWRLAEPTSDVGAVVYEQRKADGLTVLVNQVLSDAGAVDWYARMDELNVFADSGESYRDLPVFVIDLRGNVGGQPAFAQRWFEGYTGTSPSPRRSTLIRWSPLNGFLEAMGYQVPDAPGGTVRQETEGVWVENDSLIFCLTDQATVSAGEWFVRDLSSMEHVVFVGSNTGGASLMSNNQTYYLPNSGLAVQFGTGLTLFSEENTDGYGFIPDLWVPSEDALDVVVRLCEHYGLN